LAFISSLPHPPTHTPTSLPRKETETSALRPKSRPP